MKKKYLSALLFGAMTIVSTGTFTSCSDYDSELDAMQEQIDEVKGVMSQLQTAVNSGAVIKNVTPTAKGVVVELSNGKSFELSNGIDGKDGKPGTVWEITEDGYWACNGEKTEFKAQGEKGDKGEAGENAGATVYFEPGIDGAEKGKWVKVTVKDGKETREITEDRWDNQSGGVVAIYEDGSLKLQNVAGTNGETIAIGDSLLETLVFAPQFVLDGHEAFEYLYTPYKPYAKAPSVKNLLKVWSTDPNCKPEGMDETYFVEGNMKETADWAYVNPYNTIPYHMNPSHAKLDEVALKNDDDAILMASDDLLFEEILGKAYHWDYKSQNDAAAKPQGIYQGNDKGDMYIGVKMEGRLVQTQTTFKHLNAANKKLFNEGIKSGSLMTLVSPAAKVADDAWANSTYAAVKAAQFPVAALAYNKDYTDAEKCLFTNADWQFKEEKNYWAGFFTSDNRGLVNYGKHATPAKEGFHLYSSLQEAAEYPATVELVYNDIEGIDLDELVEVHMISNSTMAWNKANQIHSRETPEELAKLGLRLEFDLPKFVIGSLSTRQDSHAWVRVHDGHNNIVATGVTDAGESDHSKIGAGNIAASVGKEPLVRVKLVDTFSGDVVKVGYIKFKVTAPTSMDETKKFVLPEKFYYNCGEAKSSVIKWSEIENHLVAIGACTPTKNMLDHYYNVSGFGLNGFVDPANPVVKQYDVKEDKDKYGTTIYNEVPALGTIEMISDKGGETNLSFQWSFDAADMRDVYNYFQKKDNAKDYPEFKLTRIVKFIPKGGISGDASFAKRTIYVPIETTIRFPQGTWGNKLWDYWFAENSQEWSGVTNDKRTFVHHHVATPNTLVESEFAQFGQPQIDTDLDSHFMVNDEGIAHARKDQNKPLANAAVWNAAAENAPTIDLTGKPDWNNTANFATFSDNNLVYFYYFTEANNGKKVVFAKDRETGKEQQLVVANTKENSPIMVYGDADYEFNNTKIYVNSVSPKNLVASISHERLPWWTNKGGKYGAHLQYAQTEVAKQLLNLPYAYDGDNNSAMLKQTIDFEIGVVAFNRCGLNLPIADPTFGVEVLKPVYAYPSKQLSFTDAEDGAQIQPLFDVVKFSDWRDNAFAGERLWYYTFYGVEYMKVYTDEIMTSLGCDGTSMAERPLKEVSQDVHFYYTPGRGGDTLLPPMGSTVDDLRKWYGQIAYNDNRASVTDFTFTIPVHIKHWWSEESFVVYVTGNSVGGTINNH